jgi:hypothetical protein
VPGTSFWLHLTTHYHHLSLQNTINMAPTHSRIAEEDNIIEDIFIELILHLADDLEEPVERAPYRRREMGRDEGNRRLRNLLDSNHNARIKVCLGWIRQVVVK